MNWYTPENMNEVCEHGSQRRKCINCESEWQDKRIADLERQLAECQQGRDALREALQDIADDPVISEPRQLKRGVSEILAIARKFRAATKEVHDD